MGDNVGDQMSQKFDQMNEERLARMPDILATTKGESQIQELRKEISNMSQPQEATRLSYPLAAIEKQTAITSEMNALITEICDRVKFMIKRPDNPASEDVESGYVNDPSRSTLHNTQAAITYELALTRDRLKELLDSLDL